VELYRKLIKFFLHSLFSHLKEKLLLFYFIFSFNCVFTTEYIFFIIIQFFRLLFSIMLIKFTAVLFIDILFKCLLYQQVILMRAESYNENSYVLFRTEISICHAGPDSSGSV
jgi:hypothetical protein